MNDIETVPFGKYKGKPVTEFINDKSYVEWVINQGFLKEKYPSIYNIVINNTKSDDSHCTPAHNQLQNEFTENENITKLFRHLFAKDVDYIEKITGMKLIDVKCDWRCETFYNWDVFIDMREADFTFSNKKETITLGELYKLFNANYKDDSILGDALYSISKVNGIVVELKPSVGDDYPNILRKMGQQRTIMFSKIRENNIRNRPYFDEDCMPKFIYCLLIDEFNSEVTSREKLKEKFSNSNILVTFKDQLNVT